MKDITFIISRTDAIGDVVLTLPLAGVLKELYPGCKVIFLGRKYTQPVVALSQHVDEFMDWQAIESLPDKDKVELFKSKEAAVIVHVFPDITISSIARKAKISLRIATSRRLYHFLTCNKLLNISRKKSKLHEAQLNLKLIRPLGAKELYSLEEIQSYYGFTNIPALNQECQPLIDKSKFNLILHPKSKGSAREWGLENFNELVKVLPADKFKIFVCGTKEEGALIQQSDLMKHSEVVDLTGKLSLNDYIAFINACDGLVAASTGPLHIASALRKIAIGLYAPMKPIFPQRWAPIGKNAHYLVIDKKCNDCKRTQDCACIRSITPLQVKSLLEQTK